MLINNKQQLSSLHSQPILPNSVTDDLDLLATYHCIRQDLENPLTSNWLKVKPDSMVINAISISHHLISTIWEGRLCPAPQSSFES